MANQMIKIINDENAQLTESIYQKEKIILELLKDKAELTAKMEVMAAVIREKNLVIEKKDLVIEEMAATMKAKDLAMEEIRLTITTLEDIVADLSKRMPYYESAHTSPSRDSLTSRQMKKRKVNGNKAPVQHKNKPGRAKGHKGEMTNKKADQKVRHVPEECEKCGSKDVEDAGVDHVKLVLDIPEIVKAILTAHLLCKATCNKCGHDTHSDVEPGVKGTSLGPNLLALISGMFHSNSSGSQIAEQLKAFGAETTKTSVQHGLKALSKKLKPIQDEIKANARKATSVNRDETPFKCGDKKGQAWIAATNGEAAMNAVLIELAESRAKKVLIEQFGDLDIPTTADGYPGYNLCLILQRCWAHILRDALYLLYDSRFTHVAYKDLLLIYHRALMYAKEDDGDPSAHIQDLTKEVLELAEMYTENGYKFGTKLANAADNLFTFLEYPDLHPTNNLAERMLRPIVISRKIRHGVKSSDGMETYSTLMTCFQTWKRQGKSVPEMVLKVLKEA